MPSQKFVARDCELPTSAVHANGSSVDSWLATRKVLEQLPTALEAYGVQTWHRNLRTASAYSMDCLRQWTSGGQCYYSDMSHVEVCTAETLQPSTFALQCFSVLRAAEAARRLAEEAEDEPLRIILSAANADPLDPSISWGSHLNLSVDEKLWSDLFVDHAHPALLGYVASAIAAGIVFFGGGKRRAEVIEFLGGHPDCGVELHDYAPADILTEHLESADVHLVSLNAEWTGTMVPSKLQGIFDPQGSNNLF